MRLGPALPRKQVSDISGETVAFTEYDSKSSILPPTLLCLIRQTSGIHQFGLSILAVLVFVAEAVPIEIQRRLVNAAVEARSVPLLLQLTLVYIGVVIVQGLLKLVFNVYRSWTGETVIRWIRREISGIMQQRLSPVAGYQNGIENAIVIAEAEPIGSFVGDSVCTPLLYGGSMISVFSYLSYLEPWMAAIGIVIFLPQFLLIPLMQAAINRRVAIRIWVFRKISVAITRDSGMEGLGNTRQDQRFDKIFTLNMGIYKIKFSLNFTMNFLASLSTALTLGYGGYLVIHGQTEMGTVVAFISGMTKIIDPWGDLVNWYRDFRVTGQRYRMIVNSFA